MSKKEEDDFKQVEELRGQITLALLLIHQTVTVLNAAADRNELGEDSPVDRMRLALNEYLALQTKR